MIERHRRRADWNEPADEGLLGGTGTIDAKAMTGEEAVGAAIFLRLCKTVTAVEDVLS